MARVAIIFLVGLLAAGAARADEVRLRASAVVAAGAGVTLADVAELVGEEAAALGDIVVLEEFVGGAESWGTSGGWAEVTLESVRALLEERGVNWGRFALTGSSCFVRPAPVAPEGSPGAAPVEGGARGMRGTIRGRVVPVALRMLGVADAAEARLTFAERDLAFLDRLVGADRVEAAPASGGGAARLMVTVRVFRGDKLEETRGVRVEATVLVDVLILAQGVERGARIGPGDVRTERLWMDPGGARLARTEDVEGSLARRRLAMGAVLRVTDLDTPVLVKRGEQVLVHCLSNGISVQLHARSLGDAREGKLVELRLESAAKKKDRKTFTARVSGRGVAVLVADGAL